MAEVRRMQALMGTFVEVAASGESAERAVREAFDTLKAAERMWSFQDPDSEISLLNRAVGKRVPLCRATTRLLRLARGFTQASRGSFNCTVGGALVLKRRLPNHDGGILLPSGDADDIIIGHEWGMLMRPVQVTVDGIAKGFAVDMALLRMRGTGAQSGWINAGGDLRVFGEITMPVQQRTLNGYVHSIGQLRNAALATSRVGPADPRYAGEIVSCGTVAPYVGVWSVLAMTAWRADALTKVAANTPAELRHAAIGRLGGELIVSEESCEGLK